MGHWNDGIKFVLPGFLTALGAALAAPILLPALARIVRPAAKEAIRLYFDLADDIQEVLAHHQHRRAKAAGLLHHLVSGGSEEIVAEGLEVEAEESLTETVLEGVAEIL
jgi:hypothetical protein